MVRRRKEVQEKLRVAINEQKQGTLILAPNQTLEVYLTYWLENVEKLTVRTRTYEQYLSYIAGLPSSWSWENRTSIN